MPGQIVFQNGQHVVIAAVLRQINGLAATGRAGATSQAYEITVHLQRREGGRRQTRSPQSSPRKCSKLTTIFEPGSIGESPAVAVEN